MTDDWSAIADDWSRLWGDATAAVRAELPVLAGIRPGDRVLDVGCGGGELLAELQALGAIASGTDPAERMVQLARQAAPAADVRVGDFERIPWEAASFDVVTAVNALHFADDADAALAEVRRVLVPEGRLAIAQWAPGGDLAVLDAALGGEADDDDPDALSDLLRDGGFELVGSGVVEGDWTLREPDLADALLLGADDGSRAELVPRLLEAAQPFQSADGYLLRVTIGWTIARAISGGRGCLTLPPGAGPSVDPGGNDEDR